MLIEIKVDVMQDDNQIIFLFIATGFLGQWN